MADQRTADQPDDVALVEAARAGDRAALNSLLVRHYDRLFAVCRRIAGNTADAEDACQEALLQIARNLDRFDGRAAFSTWAYRVATNACLDELRRRRRRPEPIDAASHPEIADPFDGAEGTADRLDIDAALANLPSEYRTVVVLRDVAGLSYAEIAEVLDLPGGTVRSRIARGREALIPLLAVDGNRDPRTGRRT